MRSWLLLQGICGFYKAKLLEGLLYSKEQSGGTESALYAAYSPSPHQDEKARHTFPYQRNGREHNSLGLSGRRTRREVPVCSFLTSLSVAYSLSTIREVDELVDDMLTVSFISY